MNVTFRSVSKQDIEQLRAIDVPEPVLEKLGPKHSWNHGREIRGRVITLDGCVVVAFARGSREVVYQDGSDAVADLVRAQGRVWSALGKLYTDDLSRIKRKGKPRPSLADILGGFA